MGGATAFNGDIAKWDVSSVTNMDDMFEGATSFEQTLCGAAWVHSKATKEGIFVGSSGSISSKSCVPLFSPDSKEQLRNAIDACLKLSPKGICSDGPDGAIGWWGVSRITDMIGLFAF